MNKCNVPPWGALDKCFPQNKPHKGMLVHLRNQFGYLTEHGNLESHEAPKTSWASWKVEFCDRLLFSTKIAALLFFAAMVNALWMIDSTSGDLKGPTKHYLNFSCMGNLIDIPFHDAPSAHMCVCYRGLWCLVPLVSCAMPCAMRPCPGADRHVDDLAFANLRSWNVYLLTADRLWWASPYLTKYTQYAVCVRLCVW